MLDMALGPEWLSETGFDAMCGLTLALAEGRPSVVAKIDGKGNCSVWPEDRISNLEVSVPKLHPTAPLIRDIAFQRCGKDSEIRLKSKSGCFVRGRRAWDFDMEAFSLLYVWPSDVAEVARMCPKAFPSLKHTKERKDAEPECEPPNREDPECEPP